MKKTGFTFIELLVVVSITLVLLTFITIRATARQRQVTLTAAVGQLVADVRSQQTKAMSGLGTTSVRFETNQYELLPAGSVFPIPTYITLSPTFTLEFSPGNGEVVGYSQQSLTITQTLTGETKTILFNRYGTITAVN